MQKKKKNIVYHVFFFLVGIHTAKIIHTCACTCKNELFWIHVTVYFFIRITTRYMENCTVGFKLIFIEYMLFGIRSSGRFLYENNSVLSFRR